MVTFASRTETLSTKAGPGQHGLASSLFLSLQVPGRATIAVCLWVQLNEDQSTTEK